MPRTARPHPPSAVTAPARNTVAADVRTVLAWLERHGTKRNRDAMARYAIHADKAFGVSMATMQTLAKRLGRNHALALALWDTGWYEARMLVSFVADPAALTSAEMERWMPRFRQLGDLRHALLPPVRSIAAGVARRSGRWPAGGPSSRSAPRSRCSPPWPSMIGRHPTDAS